MSRQVLVLGGYGNIGAAIVQKFKEEGDTVTTLGRRDFDLSSPEMIKDYFSTHSPNFDVLVQSAGLNEPKKVEDITPLDLQKSLSINTLGFLYTTQHLLPYFKLQREGYILAISSLYGSISRVGRLPYCTAKHALNGVIKTLALELGQFNIKVNSLSPGFIDTQMTRKNNDLNTIKSFESRTPLGRLGKPQEIANIAYFLCSPQNQFLHGQDIIADGGYSIGGFQNT